MSNNNNNNNNNNNIPGLDALAALYSNFGTASSQDTRSPAVTARAMASLASQPTSMQAPAGPTSPSTFDMQTLYAQKVQQLTAAQQQATAQHQQQQQAQSQALLSSLPGEVLQAYLTSMTSQLSNPLNGIVPFLGNNTQQAQQQQNQQTHAYAQAIAAQILASSKNNSDVATQRPLSSATSNVSSILQGDLTGTVSRGGATNGLSNAASDPAPGFLNQVQAATQSTRNTPTVSELSTNSIAEVDTTSKSKPLKASNKPPNRSSSSTRDEKKNNSTQSSSSASSSTSNQSDKSFPTANGVISEWEDKKLAKRAANRISAHLSRKRKKMFIDDVTTENTDLRRKVQILQSIPDLIVVFNSSGCISFVSQSLSALLDLTNQELEGTSFWDLLTDDSVNLIKSAFMDALAEKRSAEDDSTVLCHGKSLMVKLVDKESSDPTMVSFKGVVHFTGVAPECVCSMRPVQSEESTNGNQDRNETRNAVAVNERSHDISDVESIKASKMSNGSISGSNSD